MTLAARWLAPLPLLLWLALPTLQAAERGSSGSEAGSPGCSRCSIVVVVLDAARADHFGCYGYPRRTTPFVDRLAKQAVVFEQAYAEASYTIASVASLLSGLPVDSHGVVSVATRLSPQSETLAEVLARHGYRTGAFSENPLVNPDLGFAQGFETFRTWEEDAAAGRQDFDMSGARRHVDEMLEWVGTAKSAPVPFLLYAHILRPHQPYEPLAEHRGSLGRPYAGSFRGSTQQLLAVQNGRLELDASDQQRLLDLYDENLRSADALVEQLVKGLEDRGRLDSTLIVVTGDHGEELLDHGKVLHGPHVFDESIRVPLLLRFPERMRILPHRQETVAQLGDLVPTLLAAAGVPVPEGTPGLDLLPWIRVRGAPPERPAVVSHGNPHSRTVTLQESGLKYIETTSLGDARTSGRLFDLEVDPGERHDLSGSRQRDLERMAARLRSVRERRREAGIPVTSQSPDRVLQRLLRQLGYVE